MSVASQGNDDELIMKDLEDIQKELGIDRDMDFDGSGYMDEGFDLGDMEELKNPVDDD